MIDRLSDLVALLHLAVMNTEQMARVMLPAVNLCLAHRQENCIHHRQIKHQQDTTTIAAPIKQVSFAS